MEDWKVIEVIDLLVDILMFLESGYQNSETKALVERIRSLLKMEEKKNG